MLDAKQASNCISRALALALALGLAGCMSRPPNATPVPQVTIQSTPQIAPASGAPPPGAAEACSSVNAQQGGGAAYLNCIERHE